MGQQLRLNGTGDFSLEIVGESHYQAALERLCGGRTENGHQLAVEAILYHEDNNQYDDNAVRVEIKGVIVGYLDREAARSFRARLADAGYAGFTLACPAMIVGGWDKGEGDQGYFGVKLDVPTEV